MSALQILARVERLKKLQAAALAKTSGSRTDPRLASFSQYKKDPVGFARDVLGLTLTKRQIEILEAVRDHDDVAVRSGHKVGKSTTACIIALWAACTGSSRARVIMTSSSDEQVRVILWKELTRLYNRVLPDGSTVRDRVGGELAISHRTGLRWPDGREIVGFATKKPENAAGWSSPEMIFIADEASGIEDRIFETLEGNRAAGAKFVMFSNPTQTSGKFFRAFHEDGETWRKIHVSSEEAAAAGIPGLATHEYIAKRRAQWGAESAIYQVRIAGNFADTADDTVIARTLVEAATARWDATEADGPLEGGLDVARFGDDESVLCLRRGYKVLPLLAAKGLDTMALAGFVRRHIKLHRKPGESIRLKVDTVGVGGGVADVLRGDDGVDVLDVNSSETALDEEEYANRRAELHFGMESFLREGGAIPLDERLHAELVAPHYGFDPRGRRKVESKEEIKKRLHRSPDRADALALCIWSPKKRDGGKPKYKPQLNYTNFDSSPIG